MDQSSFGTVAKSCRLIANMSQTTLNKLLFGKDNHYKVQAIESGKEVPDVNTVMRWGEVTGCRHIIAAYFAGNEGYNQMIDYQLEMHNLRMAMSPIMKALKMA